LLGKAKEKHVSINEVAYKQAEADYFEAHKQIEALEEQTIKYLTGENTANFISTLTARRSKNPPLFPL
jgi:hypothetical protein